MLRGSTTLKTAVVGNILALVSSSLAVGVVCFMLSATGYSNVSREERACQLRILVGRPQPPFEHHSSIRQCIQDDFRIDRSIAELPSRKIHGRFFEHYGHRPLGGGMKPPMTSNMLPLKKCIELLFVVKPREWFSLVCVPSLAPVNQVCIKGV